MTVPTEVTFRHGHEGERTEDVLQLVNTKAAWMHHAAGEEYTRTPPEKLLTTDDARSLQDAVAKYENKRLNTGSLQVALKEHKQLGAYISSELVRQAHDSDRDLIRKDLRLPAAEEISTAVKSCPTKSSQPRHQRFNNSNLYKDHESFISRTAHFSEMASDVGRLLSQNLPLGALMNANDTAQKAMVRTFGPMYHGLAHGRPLQTQNEKELNNRLKITATLLNPFDIYFEEITRKLSLRQPQPHGWNVERIWIRQCVAILHCDLYLVCHYCI